MDTIEANARFFGGDISKVPKSSLTVGVGTVMDAKEVQEGTLFVIRSRTSIAVLTQMPPANGCLPHVYAGGKLV